MMFTSLLPVKLSTKFVPVKFSKFLIVSKPSFPVFWAVVIDKFTLTPAIAFTKVIVSFPPAPSKTLLLVFPSIVSSKELPKMFSIES